MDAADAEALAREAYLFGLPLVYTEIQKDQLTNVSAPTGNQAPVNQFAHHREFPDAKNNPIVGMNVDTLYSLAFCNLSAEPLVISVPPMDDGRYWIMQIIDGWNEVPAAPGFRTVGDSGGNWLLTGPRWSGTVTDGVRQIPCATAMINIGGRIYTTGPEDYAAVHALQDRLALTPLAAWGSDCQPPTDVPVKPGVDAKTPVTQQIFALSAEEFFTRLCRLLVDNPAHDADAPVLQRIAAIGIAPGAEPHFDDAMHAAIDDGVRAAQDDIRAGSAAMGEDINGWQIARDLGHYGTKYLYRAVWTYYGIGGNLIEDACYPLCTTDSTGQPLSGEHRYRLHFGKDQIPPVDAFWSLTMYDIDSFLVPNPIDRYSLSSRDQLNYGDDGSLEILIQVTDPGSAAQANWLPAPAGEMRVSLRLYIPKPEVAGGHWAPPAIKRLD
jgi:hypothetical protein